MNDESAASAPRFRFAGFELVSDPAMLTRSGVRIPLQPQPAKALVLLLERGGEIVTREELRAHIWGEEVYLDHEQGINFVIRRIRSALGDDSTLSRFVETIPRVGYRFVAPVERLGGSVDEPPTTGRWLGRRWVPGLLASLLLVAVIVAVIAAVSLGPRRSSASRSKGVASLATLPEPPLSVPPAAHEAYLRGRYLISQGDADSIEQGIAVLQQAIVAAPDLALAHAALATAYLRLGVRRPTMPIAIKVESAARRAVALDDQLAEGHLQLATARFYFQMDWSAAGKGLQRALELNPRSAEILHTNGLYLASLGRHDEAIAFIRRAVALDPATIYLSSDLSQVFFWARRYDQAIAQARATLELAPADAASHRCIIGALLLQGDTAAALEQSNAWLATLDLPASASLAEAIDRAILELSQREADGRIFDLELASLLLQRGDEDLAMDRLARACTERSQWTVPFIAVDPRFDALRSRPEYRALDCLAPTRAGL